MCIRPEAVYCFVEYAVCPDDNSFSIDSSAEGTAETDNPCTEDHLLITGYLFFNLNHF